MSSTSRILELSGLILTATQQLHDSLTAQGIPLPSFDEDFNLPSDLDDVRDTLLDATSELHDLLYGFQNLLSSYASVCVFVVSPAHCIYAFSRSPLRRFLSSCIAPFVNTTQLMTDPTLHTCSIITWYPYMPFTAMNCPASAP